jgi:hypothetical protein
MIAAQGGIFGWVAASADLLPRLTADRDGLMATTAAPSITTT